MDDSDIDAFPLIETKLHRPPVPTDLVPRERLTAWLNQRTQRPLTLVSAPAGYGKTTLISRWMESLDCPVAWVSLDEYDNDLAVFLGYFTAAIQGLFPQALKQIQALIKSPEMPPTRYLAGGLINDLNAIQGEYVLALDDYHLIHEKNIHDLLNELLLHPPQGLHLVLGTRTDPPLGLMNLRVRGQVTEVRTQDLRFTSAEIPNLMEKLLDRAIGADTASSLEEQTEGWVTGLRLAALAMRYRVGKEFLSENLSVDNRYINDYLISEILANQMKVYSEWLVKSSIMERFCSGLLETVLGKEKNSEVLIINGEVFLQWLESSNMFTIPLDDHGEWFRYHHLFRDFLQRQITDRYDETEITALHSRTSAWYAQNGLIEEALQHALAANDTATAVDLVAQYRHDLMNVEQWHRLRRWINLFPPRLVEENIQLLITKAWILHNRANISGLESALNQAESFLNQQSPEPFTTRLLQAEIDTLHFDLYHRKAEVQNIIPIARRALDTLPHEWFSARGLALFYLNLAYQHKGDSDQAYQVIQEALNTDTSGSGTYHGQLLAVLCFIHWENARLPALRKIAKQYFKLGKKHNLPESIAFANYFLGCFHYHQNDLGKAETYLYAAAVDNHTAIAYNTIQSACVLAMTYLAMGKNDRADEIVSATTDFIYEADCLEYLPVIEAAQAELALRQGRTAEAAIWAHAYDPYPFPFLIRFFIPQLTYAKVLLALNNGNNFEPISDLLFQLQEHVERLNNTRFMIDVLALQALLKDLQGDRASALGKLEQAVRLAEPGGWIRPFVDLGPKIADLLYRLRNQDVAQDYISQILEVFPGPEANELSASRVNLVEPLTGREMEILGLLAQQLSNKEIAAQLVITKGTVKQHTHKIYQKLGVKGRWQAVIEATRLSIITAAVE